MFELVAAFVAGAVVAVCYPMVAKAVKWAITKVKKVFKP